MKIEKIGDHWEGWGDVVNIGLRRTQIRNTDGVMVNYPNAVLANSVITNFSFETNAVRVRIRFMVPYSNDLNLLRSTAVLCIETIEGIEKDSADIVTRSLWDDTRGHLLSGILVEGRYRIHNVRERTRIRSKVLEALLIEFRGKGISLAPLPKPSKEII